MSVVIYHNPECGTSRNVLALIRHAGIEPTVIEYLKTPPGREEVLGLAQAMGLAPREMLRRKGTPYDALGLDDPSLSDDAILDAILLHPILIQRPIVIAPKGVRVCRPSEAVLDLLPDVPMEEFRKEDGELVIAADGRRVACR